MRNDITFLEKSISGKVTVYKKNQCRIHFWIKCPNFTFTTVRFLRKAMLFLIHLLADITHCQNILNIHKSSIGTDENIS